MIIRFLLLTMAIVLIGCSSIREIKMKKQAIEQGVPSTVDWIGGKDGGEWVNFTFETDSLFHIDTYSDYTYEKKVRFSFVKICVDISERQIRKEFQFTNGQMVIWKNGGKVENCVNLVSE